MITLSSSTFDQALTGNALVFFHRLKGCPNCDKMAPHFESFQKEGVNVFDVDVDTEKELTQKYAPMGQWNLPLCIYFENGKVVNMTTGITNIMDITKTLDNISYDELQSIRIDTTVEYAKAEKHFFELGLRLRTINTAIQKRDMGPQILSENIPQTAPLSSIKLPEDDFQLGESTAAEPEICESCQ